MELGCGVGRGVVSGEGSADEVGGEVVVVVAGVILDVVEVVVVVMMGRLVVVVEVGILMVEEVVGGRVEVAGLRVVLVGIGGGSVSVFKVGKVDVVVGDKVELSTALSFLLSKKAVGSVVSGSVIIMVAELVAWSFRKGFGDGCSVVVVEASEAEEVGGSVVEVVVVVTREVVEGTSAVEILVGT